MSLLSRTVPVRHKPDFWPSRFQQRLPYYHDPFLYETYDDPVCYDFERRPITSNHMWSSFDNEMRNMSDEMDKTYHSVSPRMNNWTHTGRMTPITSDWRTGGRNILPCQPSVDNRRITENFRMDNPITEDHSGSRKFYLEYDMSQFKPEEINVKISGRELIVFAKHEEKGENHSSRREYARKYLLPEEVKEEMLTSKLSEAGKLTIEAPLPLPALKTTNKDTLLKVP